MALTATFSVTGLRLAELIALNLNSLTGPSGARRLQVTGKGKRDRAIPIQPGLEDIIDRYLRIRVKRHGAGAVEDPRAPLFVHYDGTRMTHRRVQYLVERLYDALSARLVVYFSPHSSASAAALRESA